MITLVLGGARSGKSVVAERLAARLPEPVSYLATAPAALVAGDADMASRVAAHRARRSPDWRTIEATGCQLSDAVAAAEGTLLVESLGTWLTGAPGLDVDVDGLCHALLHRRGDTVLVSEEVGLGVHPSSDAGRRFRDALGEVNQAVAAIADEVLLVVAGRALALKDVGIEDVGSRDSGPAGMIPGGPSALEPGVPRSGIRVAVAFLTPFAGAAGPTPAAVLWFPVVGAVLGLTVGAIWWAAAQAWPAPVVAVLVVVADLGLTGMLHFDGLLDSADGLLAHVPRERRLAVMSRPDVGAFAAAVGVVVMLGRWASIASLRPAPLLVAGLWCASRTLMAATMRLVPYARDEGGLATAFLGPSGAAAVAVGGIGALALATVWRTVAGPAAVGAGVAAGIGVVLVARHKLGGFTGDVLGAAGVVAETVGLIVAAAKW